MLIIDNKGDNLGRKSKSQGMRIAQEAGLDLVLIAPDANPPVAKVMEWGKFRYEQERKRRESRGKRTETKEMWFKPKIEDGDIDHKVKRVEKFIEEGDRVKITIKAKGRVTKDEMRETMAKVLSRTGEFADIDSNPKFEGRNYTVFINKK